jgi:hypothetical protein
MRPATMRSTVLVLALALSGIILSRSASGESPIAAAPLHLAAPTAASRAHGLQFDGVQPADQQAILDAVASAQPQARALVDRVAGLVTIRVGDAGPKAWGYTDSSAAGYAVLLDLAEVSRALGTPGVHRLVLHELGHVVRHALVSDALLATLDAGIPRGYGCDGGITGACTSPEERFAETFAKWGMDDIGVYLDIGYRVPPPTNGLAAWAEPLALLTR